MATKYKSSSKKTSALPTPQSPSTLIGIGMLLGAIVVTIINFTFQSPEARITNISTTDKRQSLRQDFNLLESLADDNSKTCCSDKERLQEILSKSITAENAGGVDGSDPGVTRTQLAQALKWCKKETKLLSKQTTEQMAEIGKLTQGCIDSNDINNGAPSISKSTTSTATTSTATATATSSTSNSATPTTAAKQVSLYTCRPGAGPSYNQMRYRQSGLDQLECEQFCDAKVKCIAFDLSHECRLYATTAKERVGSNAPKDSTWCTKPSPTTSESSKAATEALNTLTPAQIAAAAAVTNAPPPTSTECSTEWITITPSNDARYESEDGPAIRLDGITQPVDITKKITVEQCKLTSMTGLFRVTKTTLCKEGMTFTSDAWVQKWVTTEYGPDEFDFHLEGPELIALDVPPTRNYLGNCISEMPYNLMVPGKYHVNMVWWRENYISHSEKVQWPVCHYDEPLGTKVYLEFGDATKGKEALETVRTGTNLPTCQMKPSNTIMNDVTAKKKYYSVMDGGRWVTTWEHDELKEKLFTLISDVSYNPKYQNPQRIPGGSVYLNGKPSSGRGVKARPFVGHEKYLWTPYECKMNFFSPEDANKCIKGKSLELRGDSHMRQLFNALTVYACGCGKAYCMDGGGAQKGWGGNQCWKGNFGRCSSPEYKNICVQNDPDGVRIGDLTADLTVSNYGQHPADGAHRWKYQKYRSSIDKYVNSLNAKGKENVRGRFLWMETVASMFRKDSWVRGYKDWRSNGRIGVYNQYATSKMQENGYGVLNTFRQSMSMTRLNPDVAHLEHAILHRSTVQQILNFLCPDDGQ